MFANLGGPWNLRMIGIALVATMGMAQSQDAAPQRKFEVASIKRNMRGDPGVRIGAMARARFDAENVWIRFLIEYAWDVRDFQVSGGPAWAGSDRYDISATKDTSAGLAQTRLMLQTLLEDRFQLALHHEKRESQVYALVTGKRGIKLQAFRCVVPPPGPTERNVTNVCGGMSSSPHSLQTTGMSIKELATALSDALQRPVIDKTGLPGTFDVPKAP
jgi:uncharacterized protein (TIGR03435 family)